MWASRDFGEGNREPTRGQSHCSQPCVTLPCSQSCRFLLHSPYTGQRVGKVLMRGKPSVLQGNSP